MSRGLAFVALVWLVGECVAFGFGVGMTIANHLPHATLGIALATYMAVKRRG